MGNFFDGFIAQCSDGHLFRGYHCPNRQFSGAPLPRWAIFATAPLPKMGTFFRGIHCPNWYLLDTSTAQMSAINYYQRSWSPNKAQYTILSKIKLVGNSQREIRSTKTAFSRFFFIISRISFWRFN